MNKHLPHLTTAIGVLLIVLAALLADQRTRLHYERAEVRTSRDVTGSVHASQEALAEVVAMSLPVEDFLQKPTHTNPERGSARVRHQAAVLRVLTGARRGMLVPANNLLHFSPSATALLSPGRRLHVSVTMAGDRVDEVLIYKPIVRFPAIIGLAAALLCLAVIALGRRGLALVAGLAVVVTGLSLVLFPLILRGVHPVAAGAIFGTAVLAVFGVFLGGRGRKGLAAVLGAAALTYVAAAAASVAQLLYFLVRAGLIGGRRD